MFEEYASVSDAEKRDVCLIPIFSFSALSPTRLFSIPKTKKKPSDTMEVVNL